MLTQGVDFTVVSTEEHPNNNFGNTVVACWRIAAGGSTTSTHCVYLFTFSLFFYSYYAWCASVICNSKSTKTLTWRVSIVDLEFIC